MTLGRTLLPLAAATITTVAAACGGDEPQAAPDHTPVMYNVLVNNVGMNSPYTFAAGQTVRVRIRFFNAAQEDLDAVESEHFGGLTFTPTSLATAVRRSDHHYQFDVIGGPAGSGTMQISFGHDELADEVSFDPAPVTITGGGGPPP
jgi:hypothetical protein